MKLSSMPKPDIKILAAAAAAAVCIGAACLSYETIYKATPEYSFSRIVAAAQAGDGETLSLSADESALAGQLFDSLIRRHQGQTAASRALLLPVKGEFIHACQTILAGDSDDAQLEAARKVITDTGNKAGLLLPASGWRYESSSWSRQDGSGYAQLTASFYNDSLQASIPITFQLEKVSARQWRVVAFADPDAVVQELQQASEAALAAANRPVSQRIDSLVQITGLSASIVGGSTEQDTYLRIQYTPKLSAQGKETLRKAKGLYKLRRADSSVLFSAPIRIALYADGKVHTSQFRLNAAVPAQAELLRTATLEGLQSSISITSVQLQDGTQLELKDSLTN